MDAITNKVSMSLVHEVYVYRVLGKKIKHYLYIYRIKSKAKMFHGYAKLTNQLLFQLDFQNVDQLAGGKCFIHDTNHRKDNKLESPELPCGIS